MPIIVGSPRSGTTLLRFMLDSHPSLAIPPETGFLTIGQELLETAPDRDWFFRSVTTFPEGAPGWKDFGIDAQAFQARLAQIRTFCLTEGFRLFYRMYAERFGKSRWGDKTPLYGHHLQHIQQQIPEARFIHIIRDGRDASLSLRQCWFSPGNDMKVLADFWQNNIVKTREQATHVDHYMEVRYEDLLTDTEAVVRNICHFIELPFDDAMLRYAERTPARLDEHLGRFGADGSELVSQERRRLQQIKTTTPPDRSRAGVWKTDLTQWEIEAFEGVAGDLLSVLGYEVITAQAARQATAAVRSASS